MKSAVRKMGITQLDLKFVDFFGRWHHLTAPPSRISKRLFTDGFGFDGSNFPGMASLEDGDLSLVPDLGTAFVDPFFAEPTISLLCRIVEADTKKPFERDPRSVAARAEAYLAEKKIAEHSIWGPEFEYYVFDEVHYSDSSTRFGFEIVPAEGRHEESTGLGAFNGYHALPPDDTLADLRGRTMTLLERAGVKTIYHHHEVGGHGQVEIEIDFGTLPEMADASMKVKYFSRMTAHESGRVATFMPKPLHGEPGSGMHFHQYIERGGKSLFYDKKGYAGLSSIGHRYIAGLLLHAPAVLAFTNPSTNSFKRLVPGFEAPVNCFFSLANRSAAIRIPKYATSPVNKRIEFRPPDATCNIYFAMAAQLMAGIDGIRRKLDPGKLGFGPYDVNIFEMDERRRSAIKPLPSSLGEALDALERDHDFLLEGGVFTESMIADWIRLKRERALVPVQGRIHPLEIQLYLDC